MMTSITTTPLRSPETDHEGGLPVIPLTVARPTGVQ